MAPRICFAPGNHPDGSHDHFQDNPFSPESIWLGYHDEPTKAFCGYISLEALVEKAQHNFAHGHKDRFPYYLTSFGGRYGHAVSSDEELKYNAQCSACIGKKNCDRCLMQYLPVEVWDYARGRATKIFLCALMLNINNRPMLALLKHRGQGSFGFQYTDGSISKAMTVGFAAVDDKMYEVLNTDGLGDESKTETVAFQPSALTHTTTPDYFTKPRDRPIVIDLTSDDEEDELPMKKEEDCESLREDTAETPDEHPDSGDTECYITTDVMKEFGKMMTNMVADFGIDALNHPEARRLRSRMGEAAKLENKEMLYLYFGLLNAALFTHA